MNIFSIIRDAWITAIIFSLLPQFIHQDFSWAGIHLAIVFGLGYALGFALNNYFDADLDANDPEKAERNFFVKYNISGRTMFLITLPIFGYFLYVASLFGWKGWASCLVLTFVMWSYSAEPFHFKTRLGWDIIIHALFVQTTPYAITLFLLQLDFYAFDGLMLVILMMSSSSGQIAGQLRDFELDKETHNTTSIMLGYERAQLLYKSLIWGIILFFIIGIILNIVVYSIIPIGILGVIYMFIRSTESLDQSKYRQYLDLVMGMIALTYMTSLIAIVIFFPDMSSTLVAPY